MKLLLTSDGLTNKSISKALLGLLTKPPKENKIVFIPTASNIIAKDRTWMVDEFLKYKKLGFDYIDIVDIAAIEKEDWEPRLREADVILVGGGNPFYLKYWFKRSGLEDILAELLKDKLYVGVSAGSMIAGPDFLIKPKEISKKYLGENTATEGLGIINFAVMPHYEMGDQDESTEEHLKQLVRNVKFPVYGLDDDSAILIDGDKIVVVSEGIWRKF